MEVKYKYCYRQDRQTSVTRVIDRFSAAKYKINKRLGCSANIRIDYLWNKKGDKLSNELHEKLQKRSTNIGK